MEHMIIILEDWDHEMREDSVGATVYSLWQVFMYESLFQNYIPENEPDFARTISDCYVFTDFFRRMMGELVKDIHSTKYNRLCDNAYVEYKGDTSCAYNVARALSETKRHLDSTISKNPNDWLWRRVHQNDYPYTPWSLTPLKFMFHRVVPTAGNGHTVNVAKYSLKDAEKTKMFNAKHTANYKQVIELGPTPEETRGGYSIDTGNNGNIF